jgi:transposase
MNTRQRKLELVKGRVLVVGVDVGKYGHVAAVRSADREIVRRRILFDNNLSGFELLANQIRSLCEQYDASGAVLGLEPTGHYWQALAYWWEDNVGPVVLVNPMRQRAGQGEPASPVRAPRELLADLPHAARCRPLRGLVAASVALSQGSRTRPGLHAVARCAG